MKNSLISKVTNNRFNKAFFFLVILLHTPPCTLSSHIINDEVIIRPGNDSTFILQLEMEKSKMEAITCQNFETIESDWIFIPGRFGIFNDTELRFADYYSKEGMNNRFRSKFRGKVEVSKDSVLIFLELPINDNQSEYFEYDNNGKYKLVYKGYSSPSLKTN